MAGQQFPRGADPDAAHISGSFSADQGLKFDNATGLFVPADFLEVGANAHDIASGTLSLTTSLSDVTGVSFSAPETGDYLCIATFDFSVTGSGVGICSGEIRNTTAGTSHGTYAIYNPASTGRVTVATPPDIVSLTASDTIVLRANKSINAGTVVTGLYTGLAVVRLA